MELRSVLAESSLFAGLPDASLDALAGIATPIALRSGERLFTEDEAAEHLYIVATGRLRVMIKGQLAGVVGALEPIGEVGMLSGEPRTATVDAIRDSQLIQIRRDRLMEFLVANPTALLLSAVLMLRHIDEGGAANRIMTALASVLTAKTVRTRDLGGTASTTEFANAVCRAIVAEA